MRPDDLQKMFEKTIKHEFEKRKISDTKSEGLKAIGDRMPEVSDDIAELFYKTLRKRASSMLRERRIGYKKFEKRHYKLWKVAFDLLESFLVVACELGENFSNHYRKQPVGKQKFCLDVVTRLQARTIHVGLETLCLLRSGFADGAHARCRTAHELAVVVSFLVDNDDILAKKYLEHEVIESYRAMKQFQDCAKSINFEPYSEQAVVDLKMEVDELIEKYGKSFNTPYGWAAEVLGNKDPKFADIEKASGLAHLRPYYRMASYNIHAEPKGIKFRLGLSSSMHKVLLVGPSNYGLFDPGVWVAISVMQATVAMLSMKSNFDSIVMGKILLRYADDMQEAFGKIDLRLKDDDFGRE